MDEFILVLGEENNILPGRLWSGYKVKVLDDKMICTPNKEKTLNYEIYFKDFKKAVFGIGNANLWLQCETIYGPIVFCSPRRNWKSEAGKKIIESLGKYIKVEGMDDYKNTLVNFGGFTVFSLIDRAFALFFYLIIYFYFKKMYYNFRNA